MIGVSSAAAGAIKLRPAVLTLGSCVCVTGAELVLNSGVFNTVPDIAEAVFGVAYKLMAGEQLSPGSYCHILGTGAAARYSLIDAGTVLKVKHIVIEGKASSLSLSLHHFGGEKLILLEELR